MKITNTQPNTCVVSICMSDALLQRMDTYCHQQGISRSEMVRDAILLALWTQTPSDAVAQSEVDAYWDAQAAERSKAACGSRSSPPLAGRGGQGGGR